MKIRNGFVSNSSSSSFVLARKKDITAKDIEKMLCEKYLQRIEKFFDNDFKYCDVYNSLPYCDENISREQKVSHLITDIANDMYLHTKEYAGFGMDLDGWHITGAEYSNQDGWLVGMFMYYNPNIESDILRICNCGN